MNNFAIGVDLGGTNLRIAAVDDRGTLIEKVALDTKVSLGRDHVVGEMCGAIQQLLNKYQNSAKVMGIGIGVPGIIDMETGLLLESPNLPGWADYPLRADIERRLNTVVILENDANVAALGEKWLGAGKDFDDMIMVTLGTGVGGGIVLDGSIWHGMSGMAGEVGHITVEPEGQPCGCGNRGCVEQYSSATAVVRMAREIAAAKPESALARAAKSSEFSSKFVYNMAMQGDEDAKKVFQRVGHSLGILMAAMVNALNLPMHVIGGGAANGWDAFAPSMFKELRERCYVYVVTAPEDAAATQAGASAHLKSTLKRKTIITRALLGSDAGLFGAARLPMLPEKKR